VRILGEGVRLSDIEQHSMLIFVVFEYMQAQSQVKRIKSVTSSEVVFDLTNSVSAMQMQRLLVEPLRKQIPEYEWALDIKLRQLGAKRVETKKAKPSKSTGKKAA